MSFFVEEKDEGGTFAYAVIRSLISDGVIVVAACSERKATERRDETGNMIKISTFDFVRFRKYD